MLQLVNLAEFIQIHYQVCLLTGYKVYMHAHACVHIAHTRARAWRFNNLINYIHWNKLQILLIVWVKFYVLSVQLLYQLNETCSRSVRV